MAKFSTPLARRLAVIRYQEADQAVDETAAVMIDFLLKKKGRIVDAAKNIDTKTISIIGYEFETEAGGGR